MELKKILILIHKHLLFLLGISLLFCSFFYAFSVIKKDTYSLTTYMNISAERSNEANEFDYDNFYILETSRKLVQSCTIWMQDEALLKDVLENSNLKEREIENYKVKASQVSDTTFKIEWNADIKKDLLKLGDNVINHLQERIEKTNPSEGVSYQLYSEGYSIKKSDISDWLAALIGAASGLWIGIVWLVLKDYLKNF